MSGIVPEASENGNPGWALAALRYGTLTRALLARALAHPALLPLLVRAAWRFRARGWPGRWPFLPLPPPAYVAWRLETAYGSAATIPPAAELERYLRWALAGGVRGQGGAA